MTILFNIVLALALLFAVKVFTLMLHEVKTTKAVLVTASGESEKRSAKMEVEARNIWVAFSVILIASAVASAFLIN